MYVCMYVCAIVLAFVLVLRTVCIPYAWGNTEIFQLPVLLFCKIKGRGEGGVLPSDPPLVLVWHGQERTGNR